MTFYPLSKADGARLISISPAVPRNGIVRRENFRRVSVMACPLYQDSSSSNSLKVCGPENRIGYAPSHAHINLFCLTKSAYKQCPAYKLKALTLGKANRWHGFFVKWLRFHFESLKGKKDGTSHLRKAFSKERYSIGEGINGKKWNSVKKQ
jgi:hypothetical protein